MIHYDSIYVKITPVDFITFLIKTTTTKKKNLSPGTQWLTPVILATWEAEAGKIVVLGQPRQMFMRPPTQWKKTWAWRCTPFIPVMAGLGKKQDPMSKITRAQRAEGVAQVVEYTGS
jgi:hypothetical protein